MRQKYNSRFFIFSALMLSIFQWACNLEETNINPNDPTDVPLEVLLPPALASGATVMAEDAAVYAGIFCNYFTGVDNQALPVEGYLLDESFNMNPLWQDFYTTPLITFKVIIEKAEAEKSPHYAGIARTMQAMVLGTAAALWGDIPYTQAFQGGENLSPKYDTQEFLYGEIQDLLDQAIVDLSESTSVFSPGTDDVIYEGNLTNWKKAAYALKARFHMHLIKRDNNAPQLALDAINNAFQSTEEELVFPYGFNEADQNTWYLYFQNTPYIQVDDYFYDLLNGVNDPRRNFMIKSSFGIRRVGPYYAGEFSSVPLISFSEILFLKAEATLRTGGTDAEQLLQNAMSIHLGQVTDGTITQDSIDKFIAKVATFSGDYESNLSILMTQKFISHFTHIEGWTDYRRTGYPELTPNPNGDHPQNPGGLIPRRFIYPQNERLFNASFPVGNPNLQDRFWWDE